jgi:serine/threonine protein kinase/WD40 repeat protein
MALSAGDKLGPYEVVAPLGAGGMGEVYRARDTRLDRTVAIKVLPEHIAQRGDVRARFEREARSVASLNHPNICSLFDIGDGYMVMELIEGETLAQRIEKGPIPLDQALKIATQIADALDRAHRAGVTHRDVKPQNIMLTRDGIKILDFGLAKSQAKPGPTEETLTNVLTTEGTVMGTPQYMAPEQFEGKEADARSDIWAFGAVLYEMVTGQKAFQGKSYASLLGAILSADPPPMAVNQFTPAWLERLVRRCLQKDPDDRYLAMHDIALDLRSPPAESAPVPAKSNRWPWAVAGALAIALLAAGIGWYSSTRPAPPRPLLHLNVDLPPATPLARVNSPAGIGGNMFAISPDGTRLVLSLRGADGKNLLYTRLLQQNQLTPLAGTENAQSPFFSPRGDWIGFFADQQIKKIAVEGGAAGTLCGAGTPGASWGDDGKIIAPIRNNVLWRIPSVGGQPVPLTKLNAGEATHRWPQVLPGSKAVLFTSAAQAGSGYNDATIEVLSLQTGERKTLLRGGFSAAYLPATTGSAGLGHLVYLHQSTLFAVPFDARRLALAGSPVPILQDVGSTMLGSGDFTFAGNGTFVYLAGKALMGGYPISWVDSSGKMAQPLHAPPGRYMNPRFSPDGKRLVYASSNGKGSTDIWVKDLERDTASRLSFLPGSSVYPLWTPDGKTIVFSCSNPAAPGLYAIRADGSGEAKRLTESLVGFPFSISPDGKRLAASKNGNGGSLDIFTFPVETDSGPGAPGIRLGQAELYLGTPFNEERAAFSPDGRWLAYESDESGRMEIFVRPFSISGKGLGERRQVSTGGGRFANWSRDGRELLFLGSDWKVMAASISGKGDTLAAGKPRVWSESRIRIFGYYDIAPDGKRLAAMVEDEEAGKLPTSLTFLVNFADELRRKAPPGN